jgi:hypothetical protein
LRQVARTAGVSLSTVQRWVARAAQRPLDDVEWAERSSRPHHTRRTSRAVEDRVLQVRHELKTTSDLGEFGAVAIRGTLLAQGQRAVPSVRTLGRILERRGALDGRRRIRRPPPPRGWYLPPVAQRQVELDSVDIVEGLHLRGGPHVEVLTVISLHGGLVGAWPVLQVTAKGAVELLLAHWRAVGLPHYVQFDNDNIFQGPHQHRDAVGRVIRLCLGLGLTPVFAPPREPGLQAAIEAFNGRWQAKVWVRFPYESVAALQAQSARYITAGRHRAALSIDSAPPRRPLAATWLLDLQAPLRGQIIYVRRTTERGEVHLLGRTFVVDPLWGFRLVRCEVDLTAEQIRCYALRRRQPDHQPLLAELPYALPPRRFQE